MKIQKLHISYCRNLSNISLEPALNGFSLIIGKNGSGKTSILEAISLLGGGKSFRATDLDHVIQHETPQLAVHANLIHADGLERGVGFSKTRSPGKARAKLGGKPAKASQLAHALPIRTITPVQSSELISGGPSHRREFIDWGVFHVKHHYGDLLKRYQRIVKQRNAALKAQCSPEELQQWNEQLAEYGNDITLMRQAYLKEWIACFRALTQSIPLFNSITFEYEQGWPEQEALLVTLEQNGQKERIVGYSLYGPHRAELIIKSDAHLAKEQLSRGQQKLCAVSMYLAQGLLLKQDQGAHPLYLIDDFGSELDEDSQALLLSVLQQETAQIIITTLSLEQSFEALQALPETKVFSLDKGTLLSI